MEGGQEISEQQQQFLQPISKFYPPNEIITKNYSLDEKPILKLMRLDRQQTSAYQQFKRRYKNIFQNEDTLGYQLNYALSTDIVFFKMNNQNYFKYKTKNGYCRYLAGLFLPVQKLISSQVRASKNIYKTLQDIDFSQYKTNVEDSFSKNCRQVSSTTARFSSNYESGNLFIAIKKKQYEYDLVLQNDINSKGNIQWFNFIVQFQKQGKYKFNILNLTKTYSHFQDGMRIVCYSYKSNEINKEGWRRGCNNIIYEKSSIKRQDADYKHYSTLKFQYFCQFSNDKVVFAYFYPYTSLDLQKFLKKTLYRKINVHMKMQKVKIGQTISGLPIYVISIQHKRSNKSQSLNLVNISTRSLNSTSFKPNKSVVFLSRQHSGETQGSFISQGIIDILMENGQIDYLKKNIDFYIFPMVNIDGVLYGNYRTNLSGADLNRVWRHPRKQLHPQVYCIKKFLNIINKQSPISLIIDLHGHSKSLNSFFYGNPVKKDILTGLIDDPRFFPYVCSKKIKQISFTQSTFAITDDKKNSARVVLSQMFPKAHVYTLQNSFYGWQKDQNLIIQYTPQILKKMGRQIVLTYLEFEKLCQKNPHIKQKWGKQITELKLKNQKILQRQNNGNSDSEAQQQLIDIQQNCDKISIFDLKSQDKILLENKKNQQRKQNKENYMTRNLMIKTQIFHDKIYKNNRVDLPSNQKLNYLVKQKKQSKQSKGDERAPNTQGFLSIIKIKTAVQFDNPGSNLKSQSIESEQRQRSDKTYSKQSILEKLKRKKIRVQQAVNSSSGMRTFLKTMGIPLEKKNFKIL